VQSIFRIVRCGLSRDLALFVGRHVLTRLRLDTVCLLSEMGSSFRVLLRHGLLLVKRPHLDFKKLGEISLISLRVGESSTVLDGKVLPLELLIVVMLMFERV